jgi:hypothetical protein
LWWEPPTTSTPTPDTIEQVARKLYEEQAGHSSFRWISWEELDEEEREDLRHQVRSVLDILECQMPGVLALLPPPVSPANAGPKGDPGNNLVQEPWPITGT